MENIYENKKPVVSIIMNCLNASKYLREAIDSVFAQTYKDWEIIFWDDASVDDSFEIAKSYGKKVRCFKSDQTYPLGMARNLALEKTEGKYVAFLDCDDVWFPQKLQRQVEIFEKNPDVGIVSSNALVFTAFGKKYKYHTKKQPEGKIFSSLLQKYFICMPTAVIRKKALTGLAEKFDDRFTQIEEMDLFLRVAHDWESVYINEVLAKYRAHQGSWSFSHRECSPKEKQILIEKLSGIYPDFEKKYATEIKNIKNQIAYENFYLLWRQGKAKEARQYFKPFLKLNKKLVAYIFSFFVPFAFFYSFIGLIKNKILKNSVHFD